MACWHNDPCSRPAPRALITRLEAVLPRLKTRCFSHPHEAEGCLLDGAGQANALIDQQAQQLQLSPWEWVNYRQITGVLPRTVIAETRKRTQAGATQEEITAAFKADIQQRLAEHGIAPSPPPELTTQGRAPATSAPAATQSQTADQRGAVAAPSAPTVQQAAQPAPQSSAAALRQPEHRTKQGPAVGERVRAACAPHGPTTAQERTAQPRMPPAVQRFAAAMEQKVQALRPKLRNQHTSAKVAQPWNCGPGLQVRSPLRIHILASRGSSCLQA